MKYMMLNGEVGFVVLAVYRVCTHIYIHMYTDMYTCIYTYMYTYRMVMLPWATTSVVATSVVDYPLFPFLTHTHTRKN